MGRGGAGQEDSRALSIPSRPIGMIGLHDLAYWDPSSLGVALVRCMGMTSWPGGAGDLSMNGNRRAELGVPCSTLVLSCLLFNLSLPSGIGP